MGLYLEQDNPWCDISELIGRVKVGDYLELTGIGVRRIWYVSDAGIGIDGFTIFGWTSYNPPVRLLMKTEPIKDKAAL